MDIRNCSLSVAGAVLGLAVLCFGSQAAAAAQRSNPRDFTGIWMNVGTLDERLRASGGVRNRDAPPVAPRERPQLTPEYQAIDARLKAEAARLAEGAELCKWPGMPAIMTYPYPFEILHNAGRVTMLFEGDSQIRRIWLNRSKHLDFDDLDPSYNGDSIGRWEGNTLVIETIGFNTETKVSGLPHSEDMRIVERIRYTAPDTIENVMTVYDPKALVKPWTQTVVYTRRHDWRIREYSCTENNRDAPNAQGERSGGVVQ